LVDAILTPTREPSLLSSQIQQGPGHLPSCGHVGQIPARRGRRAPPAAPGIHGATALKDAADGPHRGCNPGPPSGEFAIDGSGPILTQVARLLEFAPHDHHEILYLGLSSTASLRDGRAIAPIDVVQGTLSRPSKPPLHGGETDVMRASHRSHRVARSHCRDHFASLFRSPSKPFLLIASHLRRFPPSIATERYWHLTPDPESTAGVLALLD